MNDLLNKKLVAIATALTIGGITAGAAFYVDMTSRVAVIEDDLEEAIQIIMSLHPPSPTALNSAEGVTLTGKKAEKKADRRQQMLEQLKQQTQPPKEPAVDDDDDDSGGDDDSSAAGDDDSTKPPFPHRRETRHDVSRLWSHPGPA